MRTTTAGVIAIAILAGPAIAEASPVLDQDIFQPSYQAGFHASSLSSSAPGPGEVVNGHAETFTVGIAGLLDSVEVPLSIDPSNSGAVLRILATSGGVPIGGAAGSVVLATANTPSLVGVVDGSSGRPAWDIFHFDLTAASLAVNVGDVYAIEVMVSDQNLWAAADASFDSSGQAFGWFAVNVVGVLNWNHAGTVNPGENPFDATFRTYVDVPAAVPEPASGWLVCIGLAGAAVIRRRC